MENLKDILTQFKEGKISIDDTLEYLKKLPFEDIGFAKVDHHRVLRTGFPEVVFCEGKTIDQIVKIFLSLKKQSQNLLLTRANESIYNSLKPYEPDLKYNELARIIISEKKKIVKKGNVLVICAGTSDIPVAEEAAVTAEQTGSIVERVYDVGVAGLHRLLAYKEKIFNATCIIAVAGMEGALPSIVGGLASCPVIAVPTSVGYGTNLKGIAPLLTMMNSCVPNVVVVNIDNGFGAGYVASLINKMGCLSGRPFE
jgi:hypothetical protein